jgi:hypothetical protein
MELLKEVLRCLGQRADVVERLDWGFTVQEVGGAMRHVLDGHYPIRRCKPFHGRPHVGLDVYWGTVQAFLQRRQGAVITAMGGRMDHWTVIRDATDRCLLLFDSDGRVQVRRRHCVMVADAPRGRQRYVLVPTHTYFLWRHPA